MIGTKIRSFARFRYSNQQLKINLGLRNLIKRMSNDIKYLATEQMDYGSKHHIPIQ
jgi:hypothetical protein